MCINKRKLNHYIKLIAIKLLKLSLLFNQVKFIIKFSALLNNRYHMYKICINKRKHNHYIKLIIIKLLKLTLLFPKRKIKNRHIF